ncbi:MAG TPA: universal stress protein [Chitinophagaceae bacterium]
MKTIIIPTDFSGTATNAMNYGLDMAIAIHADVILFHVYNVPVGVTDVPVMLVSVEELEKNAQAQMASLKSKVDHITSGLIKITTETQLGDTVDELEKLCDRVQPFAVIMATRNASGMERALFGSTTMSAVDRLKWPVIAVPPGKEYGKGISKIGFACDLEDVTGTTPAEVIRDIVQRFNATLDVLNVSRDSGQEEIETYGEFVLLKSMLAEIKPTYAFIKNKDVEDGINEFAETNNLDLVIAVPKKHQLLDRFFKKRASKQLVFHSHVPVMCIHV